MSTNLSQLNKVIRTKAFQPRNFKLLPKGVNMETKNNKGFSLIEILVAMTLIGVLSAMAIPAYNSYRKDANKTVLKADVGNAYKAIHTYNAVNSTYCAKLDDLKLGSLKIQIHIKKVIGKVLSVLPLKLALLILPPLI